MTSLTLMMVLFSGEAAPAQNPYPQVRVLVQPTRQDMVIKWNEVALQAIREDRSAPPVAARNLAIVHLSIYDAVMAIARTHQPYLVEATPGPGASMEAAAAAAAHRSLIALYPKQREALDLILARCRADLPASEARDEGESLGRFVAERLLEARQNDGAERAAQPYRARAEPGLWRPTPPRFDDALLPEWGYVKPFAIRKGTQHQPAGPPALTSSAFADAFEEVRRLGGKSSTARTEEQTRIAYFWADNVGTVTPPGHWNKIAQTLAQDRGNTLAENARLFAHLNVTLADTAVLCWIIKFTFDCWRPITAIRERARDRADAEWTPLLDTPPFPAYTSGHSTFSGAAASVLAQSFGTDKVQFSTTSDDLPGVSRRFTSLWSAAEEAGMSRIYGGIHWSFDNMDGLRVGKVLGEYVYRNTLQPRTHQAARPALYFEPPIIITDR